MNNKAIITGIGGQDGAYLANHLLEKGYEIIGIARRSSVNNLLRLDVLGIRDKIEITYADLEESLTIQKIIKQHKPSEFYNLAAQSFVEDSFRNPVYTSSVNAMAVLNILESLLEYSPDTRFYQASTSEMYGKIKENPQSEETPFHPRSPYGVAKLYAHFATLNYRESYNMHASSGILFNHESPLRGENFVTKKIIKGLINYQKQGKAIQLGNLDAKRDWGFAGDYVIAMHLMLQQKTPDDYVIATGVTHSIRYFAETASSILGINLEWRGENMEEVAIDKATSKPFITINPKYFRPAEVDILRGNPQKAIDKLGWNPETSLEQLIEMMIEFQQKGLF
ncbi:GDP-mannose 4,6-dehydratase [Gammaproteobacteria bacterium]|nr:GDP-mannose 4,6-dehydratase [Gammaproteobacteria bacterium]